MSYSVADNVVTFSGKDGSKDYVDFWESVGRPIELRGVPPVSGMRAFLAGGFLVRYLPSV